jgi:hypothetical protein
MHFVSKPIEVDVPDEPGRDEESTAAKDAEDRQAAARILQIAAISVDAGTRKSLLHRAAELLLPRRDRRA